MLRWWMLLWLGCGPGTVALDGDDTQVDEDTDQHTDTDTDTDTDEDTGEPEPPDYRETGPYGVSITSAKQVLASCTMDYDRFTPSEALDPDLLVVLSHGFSRSMARVEDWAAHLASWGLEVVTPDLCHAGAFNADHPQNGVDLRELATALGASRVVYVGHSAGGLASLLAAADDPKAVALVGLDLVDNDEAGLAVAGDLSVPAAGLIAEAHACNDQHNGLPIWEALPDAWALKLPGATHCTFESPTNWGCSALCGGAGDDPGLHEAIRALLPAFITWKAGLDAGAEAWWTPGEDPYEDLLDAGVIAPL